MKMLRSTSGIGRRLALPRMTLVAALCIAAVPVLAQTPGASGDEVASTTRAALQALAQPHVQAKTLTLSGRPVRVDIYSPAGGGGDDAIVLAHGFMRTRASLAGHAAALAEAGYLALASDLPYGVSARDNAEALAELVALLRAGALGAAVDRVVLVGFSAGALAALFAAVTTPGVAGYVALDPIDFPDREGLAAARQLNAPAVLLHGPPSACNVFRVAAPWAAAMPALLGEQLIGKASHCDFEAPSDGLCTALCGATDAERQAAIRAALLQAAARLLPPR